MTRLKLNGIFQFLFIFLYLDIAISQKCSIVYDKQNVTQSVLCQNVNSMNDIVNEIKNVPAWTNIKIVNKSPFINFNNSAVNIPYLSNVQSLDLSHAGTLILNDDGFNSYDSLRDLDISNTDLKLIKYTWFSKKNIEILNVSFNKMKELKRENMKFFPKLRAFNGSYNDLAVLEAHTFIDSKKLESITLSNNHIQAVHFESLDSLKFLNLRSNWLNGIGGNYVRMPKLEVLNLAENLIHGVADRWMATLESLKYLNLSFNKMPYVGDWTFGGVEKCKLAEFDLSYNAITIIYPACFHHLPQLTFLDLSHNKIKEVYAKNFEKQTLLQTLYLTDNRIEKINPNSFENLLQLRILDVSENKLTTFTANFFGSKFGGNRLRKLNLADNELTSLDASLFAILKNLISLNAAQNNIKEISADTLKNNINLMQIILDNNEIEFLQPDFFQNFNSLEEFSIQSNRISFVPDTANLKKLERISIGNNPMQCVCMKELLIWSRMNKCNFINAKSNPKNPDCVVLPETTCIKTKAKIDSYDIYNRFLDAMPLEEVDRSSFMF